MIRTQPQIMHKCSLSIRIVLLAFLLFTGACNLPLPPNLISTQPSTEPAIKTTSTGLAPYPSTAVPSDLPPAESPDRFPTCEPDPQVPIFQPKNIRPLEPIPPRPSSLRELASQHGIWIGTATAPQYFEDPLYAQLLIEEFNLLTPEVAMKWEVIHPQADLYDFSLGDQIVDFAIQNGMIVRGHVLVWELQMPAWVTEANHSRREWIEIYCKHIKTIVNHYRGYIYSWDVVNEAVNNDGTLRNTFWMGAIGPEYIAMAFQWAREADPAAKLFYNDNGGEGLNAKSQAIYMLIQGLQQSGIPIDGIGLQMHTGLYVSPPPGALKENMQRLADLGLEIHVTEMDVRLQHSQEGEREKLKAQAEIYRQVMEACLSVSACKAFVTWGMTDRYSWIPGWTGNPDAPLLFAEDGAPKPAYFAIQQELAGRSLDEPIR